MKNTRIGYKMPDYLDSSFTELFNHVKNFQRANIYCNQHSFDHTLRVIENQHIISRGINLDERILFTSGLFHDIIRPSNRKGRNHTILSANEAKRILPSFKYKPREIEIISGIILQHNLQEIFQRSDESTILFEADKMDLFGREGVNRWIEFGSGDGLTEQETLKGILRIQIKFLKQYQFKYENSRQLLNIKGRDFFKIIQKKLGKIFFNQYIEENEGNEIINYYLNLQ